MQRSALNTAGSAKIRPQKPEHQGHKEASAQRPARRNVRPQHGRRAQRLVLKVSCTCGLSVRQGLSISGEREHASPIQPQRCHAILLLRALRVRVALLAESEICRLDGGWRCGCCWRRALAEEVGVDCVALGCRLSFSLSRHSSRLYIYTSKL